MTNLQLTAKDHIFLEYLLHAAKHDPIFQQLLRRKLETANVVLPEMLDPCTATIGSHVTFSIGGGCSEQRVLTRHESMPAQGVPLPVTTLRGLALLGLRAGDIFALRTHSGVIETLRLESVSHPEARHARRQFREGTVVAFPPLQATICGESQTPDDDPGPHAA